MWKKRLIEKECAWCGVNGRSYDTIKFIDNIFYSIESVKSLKHYITFGAVGACVGGSGFMDLAISSINGTLKPGQPKVTEEEVLAEVKKMAEEILADPKRHKFVPPRFD